MRIPDKCKDRAWFEHLHEQLEKIPGVSEVETSELSGGALLLHPDIPYNDLEMQLASLGLFELKRENLPIEAPMDAVMSRITNLDNVVSEVSQGGIDLPTLAFVGYMGLTLQQLAKGNLVGPAIPMLFGSIDLAYRFSSRNKTR